MLPDDKTIVIEHFHDETGSNQVMVHSVFGRQVNEPLAILSHEIVRRRTKTSFSYFVDDDGFLIWRRNAEVYYSQLIQIRQNP